MKTANPITNRYSLPAKAVVEDAASLQELIRAAGFEPDSADATGQALWREMRKRHDSGTAETRAAS